MEVCTVGGFEEVGKNMTAVKVGEDVFLFDAGLYLPGVIELQDRLEENSYNEKNLRRVGGIPDDKILDDLGWSNKVKAIFISHAHLDHVGGAPYIAHRYPNATIFGTPFTMEVLRSLLEDEHISIPNNLKIVQPDSITKIEGANPNIRVEFVHTTHSTIDCTFVALHTPEGIFFYGLDMKFDNYPTMGRPPNYKRLKEIGNLGVKVAVVDSLYASTEKKPGGEKVAQHLLEEAFSRIEGKNGAFFVTTFSSHIERLNNIVNLALRTNREIVFLGRSLNKYVQAAIRIGKCPFRDKIKILRYRRQINSFLSKLQKDRRKYFVVCTGHQGEKDSMLDRIVKGTTEFHFTAGDNLIFSSSVIPTGVNIESREKLDAKLRKAGVKLQADVHVHGHGSREDLREFLTLIKPQNVIPAHGTLEQEQPFIDLSKEFGYKLEKTSFLAKNGQVFNFQ